MIDPDRIERARHAEHDWNAEEQAKLRAEWIKRLAPPSWPDLYNEEPFPPAFYLKPSPPLKPLFIAIPIGLAMWAAFFFLLWWILK